MTKGAYYKHENCTDMIVLVLKSFKAPRGFKVKLSYHFRSAIDGSPIPHGEVQSVFITNERLPRWKRYTWSPQ